MATAAATARELNERKTRVVYCKQSGRPDSHEHESFAFLGYTFRPRLAHSSKLGGTFGSFLPAIGDDERKRVGREIRRWRLRRRTNNALQDLADAINVIVRGWTNYTALLPHRTGVPGGGSLSAAALISMGSPLADLHSVRFSLELLHTGSMLSRLVSDLSSGLPADAYPGEEPRAVVIEMLCGTIATALRSADPREVKRATELIGQAGDRAIEHVRLVRDLSLRVHGDDGVGRTYG